MNTSTKGTGRGAFSEVVRKSLGNFGCPILKYFTQNYGILKVINVIELEKFIQR